MKTCDPFSQEYRENKARLPGQSFPWLAALRDRAISSFVKQGLPTLRDENWKYTSIKQLENQHYAQQLNDDPTQVCTDTFSEIERFFSPISIVTGTTGWYLLMAGLMLNFPVWIFVMRA